MEWTKAAVTNRLAEISQKGFIPIPEGKYRNDDGIVGQILEREFDVPENNLHLADLGTYELKGMRKKKKGANRMTLFHKTSTSGLSPLQLFERFCYVAPSKRTGEMKKKFFTTVKGSKLNKKGFILRPISEQVIELYYHDEYLATWDLTDERDKINRIIFALAETQGKTNSKEERFHFVEAYILSEPKGLAPAIFDGSVDMDFCIDQPADESKVPHDRGPHIRISVKKLDHLFLQIERIL